MRRDLSSWKHRFGALSNGRQRSPIGLTAIRATLRRVPWALLLMLVGLVVQAILVSLLYELVDLCISLFEVWAELARKHLEIVLS